MEANGECRQRIKGGPGYKGEKFIIVGEKDTILLRKLEENKLKRRILKLLDYFADKFAEAEVTERDVEVEIAKARKR